MLWAHHACHVRVGVGGGAAAQVAVDRVQGPAHTPTTNTPLPHTHKDRHTLIWKPPPQNKHMHTASSSYAHSKLQQGTLAPCLVPHPSANAATDTS
jgi:hypothetical protein